MSGVWSSNNINSKQWLSRLNLPPWYHELTPAHQKAYLVQFPNGPQSDSVDGLYLIEEDFFGLVSNTSSTWWDLFSIGTLQTGVATSFPSTLHDSVSGTVDFVSDNAADTAGGAGLNSVFVFGYDGAVGKVNAELLTLNGITPVPTTNNYSTIGFIMAEVGSGKTNTGNIDATATGGAVVMGNMIAASGLAKNSNIYIPDGYILYIESLTARGPEAGCNARWGFLGARNQILPGSLGIEVPLAGTETDINIPRSFVGPGSLFLQGESATASKLMSIKLRAYMVQV